MPVWVPMKKSHCLWPPVSVVCVRPCLLLFAWHAGRAVVRVDVAWSVGSRACDACVSARCSTGHGCNVGTRARARPSRACGAGYANTDGGMHCSQPAAHAMLCYGFAARASVVDTRGRTMSWPSYGGGNPHSPFNATHHMSGGAWGRLGNGFNFHKQQSHSAWVINRTDNKLGEWIPNGAMCRALCAMLMLQ